MENTLDMNMAFEFDLSQFNGKTLRSLIYMLYTRSDLINRATGSQFNVRTGLVYLLELCEKNADIATVLQTIAAFEAVHGPGITGLEITAEKVRFTGFPIAPDVATLRAFGQLTVLMVRFVMNSNRIVPHIQDLSNERYAMHGFLTKLGMNGKEFAGSRTILMQNLTGNAGFRTQAAAIARSEKQKRIRAERRGPRAEVTFEYFE